MLKEIEGGPRAQRAADGRPLALRRPNPKPVSFAGIKFVKIRDSTGVDHRTSRGGPPIARVDPARSIRCGGVVEGRLDEIARIFRDAFGQGWRPRSGGFSASASDCPARSTHHRGDVLWSADLFPTAQSPCAALQPNGWAGRFEIDIRPENLVHARRLLVLG